MAGEERDAQTGVADLLPRIGRGDREAVRQCLDRYGGLVWALARRHCGDAVEAEDAVQEIFVELWRHARRFDPARASERTFVAMVARRRLIDRHRRRARRPEWVGLDDERLAATRGDPSLGAEARRVVGELAHLSAEQRDVLWLSTVEGLSHTEIARQTGMPLGTVKSHARRGLMQLRARLEGELP
jgi:RNA polymerase sigma-70 factor (ECF subfamily)